MNTTNVQCLTVEISPSQVIEVDCEIRAIPAGDLAALENVRQEAQAAADKALAEAGKASASAIDADASKQSAREQALKAEAAAHESLNFSIDAKEDAYLAKQASDLAGLANEDAQKHANKSFESAQQSAASAEAAKVGEQFASEAKQYRDESSSHADRSEEAADQSESAAVSAKASENTVHDSTTLAEQHALTAENEANEAIKEAENARGYVKHCEHIARLLEQLLRDSDYSLSIERALQAARESEASAQRSEQQALLAKQYADQSQSAVDTTEAARLAALAAQAKAEAAQAASEAARSAAESSQIASEAAADNARASEAEARNSETAAGQSATEAALSETNAAISETNARDYAESASAAAGDSADSLTQTNTARDEAKQSATESAQSASESQSSAVASAGSAGAAKASENSAETSAAEALASEGKAKTSETNAGNSAAAALVSQNASKASETASAQSAATATESASTATEQAGIATSEAEKSQASAVESASSAAESATSAATGNDSAIAARASELAAASSATSAATSATNAQSDADAADQSATNAGNSASASAASATLSQQSATTATEQANRAEAEADRAEESGHGALKQTSNLSDLADKPTARNNLDVYSQVETDSRINEKDSLPDQSGADGKFLGSDGTAASWQEIPAGIPIGGIIPYYGSSAPMGWLGLTKGAKISKADYPALYEHLASQRREHTGAGSITIVPSTSPYAPAGSWQIGGTSISGEFITGDYFWQEGTGNVIHLNSHAPNVFLTVVDIAGNFPKNTSVTGKIYRSLTDIPLPNDECFLPDAGNNFIKGYEPTGARKMGTFEQDAIRNITGITNYSNPNQYALNVVENPTGAFYTGGLFANETANKIAMVDPHSRDQGCSLALSASRVVPTGPENVPKNLNCLWIIKAYDAVNDPEQLQAKAVIEQVTRNTDHITGMRDFVTSSVQGVSNPNLLINGDFSVWQRGVSHLIDTNSNLAPYACDRWQHWSTSNALGTYQAYTWTPLAGEFGNINQGLQMNLSGTVAIPGQYFYITQTIENMWSYVTGEDVTFSFWIYAPGLTNKGAIRADLFCPDISNASVPQKNLHDQITGDGVVKVSCSWSVPKHNTGKMNSSVILRLFFESTCKGNIYISNTKLELGPVATPFIPDDPATNLAKCQRYYIKTLFNGTRMDQDGYNGTWSLLNIDFPSCMRSVPTVILYGNSLAVSSIKYFSTSGITLRANRTCTGGGVTGYEASAEL